LGHLSEYINSRAQEFQRKPLSPDVEHSEAYEHLEEIISLWGGKLALL